MSATHYFDSQDEWEERELHTASFRRWMVATLRKAITFHDSTSEAVRAATCDALCGRAPELVTWHADDRYRGDEYANGGWSLSTKELKLLLPWALQEARREVDRARCATLDSFLAALQAGEIEATPPEEPHATSIVDDPNAFWVALHARRVPCKHCGTLFARKSKKERACPECRRQWKEVRATNAAEDQAARQAGARFLKKLLKERAIDPFAFPKDLYVWLTDAAVREWLVGPNTLPGSGLTFVGGACWGLTKFELRLVRWAFRRQALWPDDLRDELGARFRSFQISTGGRRDKAPRLGSP